jgi:FkbM family methyltransferase
MKSRLVGDIQRTIARSGALTRLMIKVKHQADSIIGLRLQSGIDPNQNGEAWLAGLIAPQAKFFIDVGANVGAWSYLFAKQMSSARGIAIEPAPATAAKLRQALLDASLVGVETIEAAASDVDGEATFFEESAFGETSSLVGGHSQQNAKAITISTRKLDSVLHERRAGFVDMLKIDAEGFDLHVIKGAMSALRARQIGVVQFEYNAPWAAAGSTLREAFSLLESVGYRVYNLNHDGLFSVRPEVTGEYFRYSNFVAFIDAGAGKLLSSLPVRSRI